MKTDEIEAMKRAIAAYAGPVTRCSPGKARAKPLRSKKVVDDATRWLQRHRHDVSVPKPFVDENAEAERGRRRKVRAERKRLRRAANAMALKRIREQWARRRAGSQRRKEGISLDGGASSKYTAIRDHRNAGCARETYQRRPGEVGRVMLDGNCLGLLEMTTNLPTSAPATRSAAAERMRRHRERRRDGLRCLMIELRQQEIDALVRNGFLKGDTRNDLYSIEMALYEFLERTLG
jgi:hypothetical protein